MKGGKNSPSPILKHRGAQEPETVVATDLHPKYDTESEAEHHGDEREAVAAAGAEARVAVQAERLLPAGSALVAHDHEARPREEGIADCLDDARGSTDDDKRKDDVGGERHGVVGQRQNAAPKDGYP